jgi:hypothetical protein
MRRRRTLVATVVLGVVVLAVVGLVVPGLWVHQHLAIRPGAPNSRARSPSTIAGLTPLQEREYAFATEPTWLADPPSDCTAAQLEASFSGPSLGANSEGGIFYFKNVSSAPCLLQGHPQLTLRDASGSIVPTSILYQPFVVGPAPSPPPLVTLFSGQSATSGASWSPKCEGALVSTVDVALSGEAQPFVISIPPSHGIPFAPCSMGVSGLVAVPLIR